MELRTGVDWGLVGSVLGCPSPKQRGNRALSESMASRAANRNCQRWPRRARAILKSCIKSKALNTGWMYLDNSASDFPIVLKPQSNNSACGPRRAATGDNYGDDKGDEEEDVGHRAANNSGRRWTTTKEG